MNELNQSHFFQFLEDVIFNLETPVTLQAIAQPDTLNENLAEVQISHNTLLLYIDETLFEAHLIKRRQSVTFRNKNYQIAEIGNDFGGYAVIRITRQ